MSDFENLSNRKLVKAAERRAARLNELIGQMQKLNQKAQHLKTQQQRITDETEKLQRQYEAILEEAKNRNIKIT